MILLVNQETHGHYVKRTVLLRLLLTAAGGNRSTKDKLFGRVKVEGKIIVRQLHMARINPQLQR